MNLEIRDFDQQRGDEEFIREIFFLTTLKKEFQSNQDKDSFYQKWMGLYLKGPRAGLKVACLESEKPSAYISFCEDSQGVPLDFSERIPYYDLFYSEYKKFPSHLHINCHPRFQGKGIGSRLIKDLCGQLKLKNIKGIHLVTDPDAKNVEFYKKNGFHEEIVKTKGNCCYLLLGKYL